MFPGYLWCWCGKELRPASPLQVTTLSCNPSFNPMLRKQTPTSKQISLHNKVFKVLWNTLSSSHPSPGGRGWSHQEDELYAGSGFWNGTLRGKRPLTTLFPRCVARCLPCSSVDPSPEASLHLTAPGAVDLWCPSYLLWSVNRVSSLSSIVLLAKNNYYSNSIAVRE